MPAMFEYKVSMRVKGDGSLPLAVDAQGVKDWYATEGVLEVEDLAIEYVGVELPKAPKVDERAQYVPQRHAKPIDSHTVDRAVYMFHQPRHLKLEFDDEPPRPMTAFVPYDDGADN